MPPAGIFLSFCPVFCPTEIQLVLIWQTGSGPRGGLCFSVAVPLPDNKNSRLFPQAAELLPHPVFNHLFDTLHKAHEARYRETIEDLLAALLIGHDTGLLQN